jgi:hypothetical protein
MMKRKLIIPILLILAFIVGASIFIKGSLEKDNAGFGDMSAIANITGVNSVAHDSICTDSEGRTLSELGARLSVMAVNITDGSSGQISAVSGSTFTVTLAGGKNNVWAVGDEFLILAGEYGIQALRQ